MLLFPLRIINKTASSGNWSFNSPRFVSAILKQIVLKAATATTTFNFSLTDEFNNIVYNTDTSATGTLRQELEIPLKGIYTIAVSGASVDESFNGLLSILEGMA